MRLSRSDPVTPVGVPPAGTEVSPRRTLFRLYYVLTAFNLGLQALDWSTSVVGYLRGDVESNFWTNALIALIGNEYVAITIEKVAFVALFLLLLAAARRFYTKRAAVAYPALIGMSAGLLVLVLVYVGVIVNNVSVLMRS